MPLDDDRFVSYAQNLEDVMLWRALSAEVQGAGFFIDVGASDPTLLSVTRAFHERGWRGVHVEPLPEQAAALRRGRPGDVVVQAAAGAAPGRRTFFRVTRDRQTGLSTFDAAEAAVHVAAGAVAVEIDVEVTTLAELCRRHVTGPVHFLKIDAEGAEGEVLAGADFVACRPWILVIEATHPLDAAPADIPWEEGLLAAGYKPVWFDGLNRFYVADEHSGLERHFRVPPNVFDRYTVHDRPLWDHVVATEAVSAARLDAIAALEAEVSRLNVSAGRDEFVLPTGPAAPVPSALPAFVPAAPEPAAPPRRSLKKRLALLAYGPVRPLVRFVAWRTRQFLVGAIETELDGHRIRLDQLIARPVLEPTKEDTALISAMERLLLTLALEDGRRPGPCSSGEASRGEAEARERLSNPGAHG